VSVCDPIEVILIVFFFFLSFSSFKFDHTPEFYLEHDDAQDILTYRQLLSSFGAEELEQQLLNDQGKEGLNWTCQFLEQTVGKISFVCINYEFACFLFSFFDLVIFFFRGY